VAAAGGSGQESVIAGSGNEALTLIAYRDTTGIHWAAGRDRCVLIASVNAVICAGRTIRTTELDRVGADG
jgi:2-isopropylmalate synthase